MTNIILNEKINKKYNLEGLDEALEYYNRPYSFFELMDIEFNYEMLEWAERHYEMVEKMAQWAENEKKLTIENENGDLIF